MATVPSVIRGKGRTVKQISKGPALMIPFTTDSGDFFVEAISAE
jgi:CheY-specific phosphatase CheX